MGIVTTGPTVAQQIHLTIRPESGESVDALVQRAATELIGRKAVAVRIFVFGSLGARKSALAALGSRLGNHMPVAWVQGASCNGHPLAGLQIQAVAGTEIYSTLVEDSRIQASSSPNSGPADASEHVKIWKEARATHCVLSGLVPMHAGDSRADQTAQLFSLIQNGLAKAGMDVKHIVRTWFYLDNILSWYGDFNRVRNRFFDEHGIAAGKMPASTGVAGKNPAGAALTAAVWAVRPDDSRRKLVRTVASPGQCPAPAYGSAFSRAAEIRSNGFRQLLISGTASIAPGGETCHVGDVAAQIDRTMEVVEGILASRKMSLADTSRAVAYFKSAKDGAVFSKWLERREMPGLPVLKVHCDLCRADLLFELELDAIQAVHS